MPAWPGGNCPDCGEYMPPNLIHCQSCRALLNPDLKPEYADIPEYRPLQEWTEELAAQNQSAIHDPISSKSAQVPIHGFFFECPGCDTELKVPVKFSNQKVTCIHCEREFHTNTDSNRKEIVAVYTKCTHCDSVLRASTKYVGLEVNCKHCNGIIQIMPIQNDSNSEKSS